MPNHDKLSATKVAKVRTPGRYGDGLELRLQVTHWKTKSNKTNVNKSWLFQYTALNGKVRQLGLGALHTLSLAEARQRARAARQLVLDGVDPIDARRAQRESARLEQAKRVTFQQCADQYIASHQSAWRNAKHREQWTVTLRTYVNPVIGALAVAEIDTALVLKVLQPIWEAKTETGGAGAGPHREASSTGPRRGPRRARTRRAGAGIWRTCCRTAPRYAGSSTTPRCHMPTSRLHAPAAPEEGIAAARWRSRS